MSHARKLVLWPFSLRARLGLLARFSGLSLIAFAILGLVLAQSLTSQIRARALANAGQAADLITRFGIQPQLSQTDLRAGLSPEAITSLDGLLRAGYTSWQVETIRIWGRDHRVIYSPDHRVIGRRFQADEGLLHALGGSSVAVEMASRDRVDAPSHNQIIDAYVPLRFTPGGATTGAFEVHLRYEPVEAAIARDTNRLYLALLVGLVLLYAALFRIVSGASRRLRRQAAENKYQAHHDTLTGLANRPNFYERVSKAIVRAGDGGSSIAVMIIDLDRFKDVNDTLGHHSGDLLLQKAAERIAETLGESDWLARLGGDEFAILLTHASSRETATEVAARIGAALGQPFVLDGLSVDIAASIGIAFHPDHGDDVETLMQRADVAMYVAKDSTESFAIYSAEQDGHSPGRLALLGELRHAIDRNEFVLHYQPKADIRTGAVKGAEALVRWQHPRRGVIAPDEFIPLAEQTGLIQSLTAWVLDTALAQCRTWVDAGLDLNVAVNLSVRDLLDEQLPISIAALLERHSLPPWRLALEITEGSVMADRPRALDVLTRLSEMGVGLSVDDFGTGYSSLAYLKDLPVRELKIDRSFVNNLTEDGSDAFIVRSTIDLARNLGLQVVAEGVETEAAWAHLAALGCDVAQGYYLSRPVPAIELTAWLSRRAGDRAFGRLLSEGVAETPSKNT